MTAIAGIRTEHGVYLGADRYVSSPDTYARLAFSKVFAKRSNLLMSCAGTLRALQVLRYKFDAPSHPKGMGAVEYLSTVFATNLRKVLQDEDAYADSEGDPYVFAVMLAYRNSLFWMQPDLNVGEVVEDYLAVGSGELTCLGSLYTTSKLPCSLTPQDRIIVALEAASQHVIGCGPPYDVYCIRGGRIKEIYSEYPNA